MKCDLNVSEDTSMSVDNYTLKVRILALVINTANLINERSTPSLSISHAVLAPVTLTTTFVFLGVVIVGAAKGKYASAFMQMYCLVCCAALHVSLSILVFKDLEYRYYRLTNTDIGLVLNGVLPMFIIILIIADLIVIMFSKREDISLPSSSAESSNDDSSGSDSLTLKSLERELPIQSIHERKDDLTPKSLEREGPVQAIPGRKDDPIPDK